MSGRSRPTVALLVACAAVGTTGACAGRYRPTLPLRALSGDVDLAVESWNPGQTRELVLRSRSQTAHTIRAGWNTVATRVPCTGGESATWIAVDSESPLAGNVQLSLPAGEHEIRVGFPEVVDAFEVDTVVDLELDDHACARVPAVSQDVPMRARERTVMLGGSNIDVTTGLNGLLGVAAFSMGVGRWIGPTLVSASAGIAGTTCEPSVCGRDADGSARAGIAVPFSLETRSLLHVFDRRPTTMVGMLTAGARYSFTWASLPVPGGDRHLAVHSLQGVLGWWLVDLPRGPFVGGERAAHMELTLPVGVAFDPSADSKRFAATFGIGFRFVFPVL